MRERADRSKELTALITAPEPPAECRSFFITDAAPEPRLFYVSTIDAMQISQHFSLPTVNGYSGQFPPGYDFLDPTADGYIDRVHVWAAAHGVSDGLCSYDLFTQSWTDPGP